MRAKTKPKTQPVAEIAELSQRSAWEQAEMLREVTSILTSTLNLNWLLDNILIYLEQVIGYDSACVFLSEGEWLHIVAGRGARFSQKQLDRRLQRLADDHLYQEIQNTGCPLILANTPNDPRFQTWGDSAYVQSWLGVPLAVRNEVFGYLMLDSHQTHAYGQTEANLAQAFANQAAVVIQNVRLFEEVRIGHKRLQ